MTPDIDEMLMIEDVVPFGRLGAVRSGRKAAVNKLAVRHRSISDHERRKEERKKEVANHK